MRPTSCFCTPLLRCIAIATVFAANALCDNAKRLSELDLRDLASVEIVSAARHEQNRSASPRSVSVISGEEIRRRNFRNVPEAVASITGVFLQQTNYGGGSPIIRGMVGNRILLMVNGIRLNNGTYRLGPNQYLSYIDLSRVDRIEVVRGAGSALYGSDAFGGVINVITRNAPDPTLGTEFSGKVAARFGTAESSGGGRAEISGAKGRASFLAGVSGARYGDLTAGGAKGKQPFTGYSDNGIDLSARLALDSNKYLVVGLGRLKQRNVERTDSLQSGADLEHRWLGQGTDFASLQYSQTLSSRYVGAIQATFSFQRPFEDLNRIAASDPLTERLHRDSVRSYNASVQLSSAVLNKHMLTYGVETTLDHVKSRRTDLNLTTGSLRAVTGTYPDGSSYGGISFFVQDEINLFSRLDAVLGVRHDRLQINATVNDPAMGAIAIDASPSSVTGSGHLLFKATSKVSVFGGVAQGFRAPNLDDSSIIGGAGSRFEIPNSKLQPERSVSMEYGLRLHGRRGQASITGYNALYRDLIDRGPGFLGGLPFLDSNGNGTKDAREPEIWQRQNVTQARVHGVEFESIVTLAERWTWTHSTTWTHGTNTASSAPLTRIPPVNGYSRVTWQANRRLWMECALVAAAAQRRLAPADKTDVRIGPAGTGGFAVIHLRAGVNGTIFDGFSVALENVANKQYRMHGSGFDRPGANLVVGYTRGF